ncbi:hypothetical protein SHIRM173S_06183 [Streptomyces hirsutus]
MGADIALEMATQLHGAGRAVAPLVLIEPYLPNTAARTRLDGSPGTCAKRCACGTGFVNCRPRRSATGPPPSSPPPCWERA